MVSLFSTRTTHGSIRVPELLARIACRVIGRLDYWAHDHGAGCDWCRELHMWAHRSLDHRPSLLGGVWPTYRWDERGRMGR